MPTLVLVLVMVPLQLQEGVPGKSVGSGHEKVPLF
jgi:hypothetical protein